MSTRRESPRLRLDLPRAVAARERVRHGAGSNQRDTHIEPGDDIVVDWGAARMVRLRGRPLDLGVSGFVDWQLTHQRGGPPGADDARYRLFGVGPEASLGFGALTVRVRAQWELAARDIVRGNNLWVVLNYRF